MQKFLKKFISSWRIIALQCCVGFCCATTWVSHMYTCIPSLWSLLPIPPPQPSRSSQCMELSSLCYTAASHWLAVIHRVVYMSANSVHLSLPSLCPHVHSVCPNLYSCPKTRLDWFLLLEMPVSKLWSPVWPAVSLSVPHIHSQSCQLWGCLFHELLCLLVFCTTQTSLSVY